MSIGQDLQKYTYAYLMRDALSRIPDTVDTREGSIIYDALAPACYELSIYYSEMRLLVLETYVLTASGEWLDMRTTEYGIDRYPANAAIKRGDFTYLDGTPATINIGDRFATISNSKPVVYVVKAAYVTPEGVEVPGAYQLECQDAGIVGSAYTGNIVPLDYGATLGTAVLSSTLVPGRDVESDDSLRARYLLKVRQKPFGGNIAQYREWLLAIPGVGACQVYPTWNGGGTVKVSIVDAELLPVTSDFIAFVQNLVDPDSMPNGTGTGLGIAPIGHQVTVVTASEVVIDIEANVRISNQHSIGQLRGLMIANINTYLQSVHQQWGMGTDLNVYSIEIYVAQIIATIVAVPGVINVTDIKLNGQRNDLTLEETSDKQELPLLGTVNFYVVS